MGKTNGNGSAKTATAKVAAVNGKKGKATKKEKEEPRVNKSTPVEGAKAMLSSSDLPKFYTLMQIEKARKPVKNGDRPKCPHCETQLPALPKEPVKIAKRGKAERYAGSIGPCPKCKKELWLPIVAWSPAHTTYWAFRAKRPVKIVALDRCVLDKPTETCEHGFPSFYKELGWLTEAAAHKPGAYLYDPKEEETKKKATKKASKPAPKKKAEKKTAKKDSKKAA